MRLLKRLVKGFYMSLGMFSAIPLPNYPWDDVCMDLVLPCFPLVGLLLGTIWWGLAELLALSGIHLILAAALLTVTPFLLTGFLHLDGYMDTSDAVFSRRPLEEKIRILKDPQIGAFSVIMLANLFVLQFAAVYVVLDLGRSFIPVIFLTVISRCCVSLSLLSLKVMPQSGYAKLFRQNVRTQHRVFIIALAVLTAATSYILAGFIGLAVVMSVIIGFAAAMTYSYKEFKGVSGDLAGFSLIISELFGLLALGVVQWF